MERRKRGHGKSHGGRQMADNTQEVRRERAYTPTFNTANITPTVVEHLVSAGIIWCVIVGLRWHRNGTMFS